MYMDYARLWKLLIGRDLTKTDLTEMTGLNARVIAKMTKNETVTTDTIARICEALQCEVGDVMECVGEDRMSVYSAYRKYGKTVAENELYRTVTFTKSGQKYTVYVTNFTATKATHVECHGNGTVYRIQLYPFGGVSTPSRVEKVLIRPVREKDEIAIVLIKGKPGLLTGLDEGTFVSSRGQLKSDADVYVMTEGAFKLFTP